MGDQPAAISRSGRVTWLITLWGMSRGGLVGSINRPRFIGTVPTAVGLGGAFFTGLGVTIVMPGHENVDLPHEMAHAVKVEKI